MADSYLDRLSPAARQAVLATCAAPGAASPRDLLQEDVLVMAVCQSGLIEPLRELLALGMPANGPSPRAVPLALLDYRKPDALDMAKLLLAQGAKPNRLLARAVSEYGVEASPMHAAIQHAPALKLLLDHGGDIHLRSKNGTGLLDTWVLRTLYQNRKISQALDALQVALDAGLSPRTLVNGGMAFLPACWSSPGLRKNFPRLFQMGFDPYQRGEGSPARRRNLLDIARIKKESGVAGETPGMLLAQFEAAELEDSIRAPAPAATRTTPRL